MFSAVQGWRRQPPVACADVMSNAGADDVCRHHTRLEALSPSRWRVQRPLSLVRCGLETYLDPRTVLCLDVAERGACAREVQVRVRGSTPRPPAAIAAWAGAGAGVQATRRAQGEQPMRAWAFKDAADQSWQRTLSRLIPESSSEALGAPAPRHEPLRHVGLSNARSRVSLS